SSINLMEHAAEECYLWLLKNFSPSNNFIIFCGTGNNGGDGLAIARKLKQVTSNIEIFILAEEKRSNDFIINLERLTAENIEPHFVSENESFPLITKDSIVIDALFGTGLNKPLEGLVAQTVQHINQSNITIVSIDMP